MSIRLGLSGPGMKAIADPGDALGRGLASIRSQFQIPETFPARGARGGGGSVEAGPDPACRPHRLALRHSRPGFVDRSGPGFHHRTQRRRPAAALCDRRRRLVRRRRRPDRRGGLAARRHPISAGRQGRALSAGAQRGRREPAPRRSAARNHLHGEGRPGRSGSARRGGAGHHPQPGEARLRQRPKRRSAARLRRALPPDPGAPRRSAGRRGSIRRPRKSPRSADGRYELLFRPPLESEVRNAALSLATNLAIADLLQAHRTGLFRVMAEPDERAVNRLRHTARGLGLAMAGASDPRRVRAKPRSRRSQAGHLHAGDPACPARGPATCRSGKARRPGMPRWPPPTHTRRRRSAAWPTATSCARPSRSPTARRCRPP